MEKLPNLKNVSRVIFDESKLKKVKIEKNNIYALLDTNGDVFYELREHPKTQLALSLILKSFINVADVIQIGEKYYSFQPQSKGLENFNMSEVEIESDLLVLRLVFNDKDHINRGAKGRAINLERIGENQFYIYDLGKGELFWLLTYPNNVHRIEEGLRYADAETKTLLKSKLDKMYNFYTSKDGDDLLESIFKRVDCSIDSLFHPFSKKENTLFEFKIEMITRIEFVLKYLNKI